MRSPLLWVAWFNTQSTEGRALGSNSASALPGLCDPIPAILMPEMQSPHT